MLWSLSPGEVRGGARRSETDPPDRPGDVHPADRRPAGSLGRGGIQRQRHGEVSYQEAAGAGRGRWAAPWGALQPPVGSAAPLRSGGPGTQARQGVGGITGRLRRAEAGRFPAGGDVSVLPPNA